MNRPMVFVKYVTLAMITAAIFFVYTKEGYSQRDTPERFVAQFYKWYLSGETKKKWEDIARYVYPATVEGLRIDSARWNTDSDYFAASNDTPSPFREMIFHKAVKINQDTSLVPIDFKWRDIMLAVLVKNVNGRFYITRVICIL